MKDFPLTLIVGASSSERRLRAAADAHTSAVWRVLRRNGVAAADADDAAQKVFMVFSRKLDEVRAGSERAFLLSTAAFVAIEMRRIARRQREPAEDAQAAPSPETLLAHNQALAQLDATLEKMDESLRAVFVLYELEEMTMASIAEAFAVPAGTVASRLRRAREQFEALCAELRAGGER